MSEIKIRCEICQEIIALADTDTLRRPMMGNMFKSPDAWHGVSDPFPPSQEWEAMKCPYGLQHRPFTTEDHVMLDTGELMEVKYPDPPKPQEKPEDIGQEEKWICGMCGYEAKSNAGLAAHMRGNVRLHGRINAND